uniref:Uncharacterized protein n=1 Tax=Chrysotila carterae TaxID=13221 RepID=A0A7S4C2A7_CHRCT
MLAASKDRFAFEIKRKALQLRQQELELVVQRYNNLAGLASIAAGFAFDSMVELEIPEDTWEELHEHDLEWLEPLFYIGASCALSLAMYVVAVASFTVVFGHRLALLGGKTNSLDKAVAIMLKQHHTLFTAAALAMFSIYVAAVSMVFLKLGRLGIVNMGIFTSFLFLTIYSLYRLNRQLTIEAPALVHGDAHVHMGAHEVDLARLGAEDCLAVEASIAGSSREGDDHVSHTNSLW